jgi:hypothetical protein
MISVHQVSKKAELKSSDHLGRNCSLVRLSPFSQFPAPLVAQISQVYF